MSNLPTSLYTAINPSQTTHAKSDVLQNGDSSSVEQLTDVIELFFRSGLGARRRCIALPTAPNPRRPATHHVPACLPSWLTVRPRAPQARRVTHPTPPHRGSVTVAARANWKMNRTTGGSRKRRGWGNDKSPQLVWLSNTESVDAVRERSQDG